MPSFDIVSKTDLAEVDNALANIRREIETRFDFKGSACSLARKDDELTLEADDPLKMKQMHELIFTHFTRRKLDRGAPDHCGKTRRRPRPRQEARQGDQGRKAESPGLGPGRRIARDRQEARRSSRSDRPRQGDEDRTAATICEFQGLRVAGR